MLCFKCSSILLDEKTHPTVPHSPSKLVPSLCTKFGPFLTDYPQNKIYIFFIIAVYAYILKVTAFIQAVYQNLFEISIFFFDPIKKNLGEGPKSSISFI